jgi:hypothetical protein
VNFVVPSSPYDELYLEQLEKSVKSGYRRRFSWLSKKDLIDYVSHFLTHIFYLSLISTFVSLSI